MWKGRTGIAHKMSARRDWSKSEDRLGIITITQSFKRDRCSRNLYIISVRAIDAKRGLHISTGTSSLTSSLKALSTAQTRAVSSNRKKGKKKERKEMALSATQCVGNYEVVHIPVACWYQSRICRSVPPHHNPLCVRVHAPRTRCHFRLVQVTI